MREKLEVSAIPSLSNSTLRKLPSDVKIPNYDRRNLTAGIVHIGLGNFHRAHQSWYLHRLMQQGKAHDWAIVGAGVKEFDKTQRIKLLAQDFLTTLIELSPGSRSVEIVGSMIDYVPIEDDNGALIAQMAKPEIKIVTLTVTEGGYYIDPVSKSFDSSHPDIVYDATHPEAPKTAFGAMVAALQLRHDSGVGPFTCQSCDNLQGNGETLRQVIVTLARLSDPKLSEWIEANCSFPNSMVDCIVPATTAKELALVYDLGVSDAVPVTHEDFRQWVIEDDFCAGRPDWDKAGATFTNDVHDFEMMKIRILNGGHQVVAVPGEVLSIETIDQCMKHALFNGFNRHYFPGYSDYLMTTVKNTNFHHLKIMYVICKSSPSYTPVWTTSTKVIFNHPLAKVFMGDRHFVGNTKIMDQGKLFGGSGWYDAIDH